MLVQDHGNWLRRHMDRTDCMTIFASTGQLDRAERDSFFLDKKIPKQNKRRRIFLCGQIRSSPENMQDSRSQTNITLIFLRG